MPGYSNGNVPAELLIKFNAGYDDLGYWEHLWPAHTLALHNALVALAAKRRAAAGLAPYPLALQTGWCAYRPLHWQQVYRSLLGIGAATPGTSSHGGTFEGSQTMAGDYAWQSVYRDCGGRAAFFEDCQSVGLLPGMIMADRGYPDEDWHVIDPDPWGAIPAGLNATEFDLNPSEEDAMKFFDGLNMIMWPNQVLNSYTPDVYDAIKGFYHFPTSDAWGWARSTFEREFWAAFDFAKNANATATAKAVAAAVGSSEADVDAIVAGVLAGLPKSYTVTVTD